MLIDRTQSLLFIIDIQERFLPHIFEIDRVIRRTELLLKAAKLVGIPVLASEQYPKGLGETPAPLKQYIEPSKRLPKMEFSCWRNPVLQDAVKQSKKQHIIIAGVETHVCILQTALKLKEAGFDVFVVSDATSARDRNNTKYALKRLEKHGIDIVTSEMVVTEWCETADHPTFKEISKLIK